MRRAKKIILIASLSVLAFVVLCLVQYIFTPIKSMHTLTGNGCLLTGDASEWSTRMVPVKIEGRWNHYLFHNRGDTFFASCHANGKNIYGVDDDLFMLYSEYIAHYSSGSETKAALASAGVDGLVYATEEVFIFGIPDVSDILEDEDAGKSKDRQPGILVFPAEDADEALAVLKEAVTAKVTVNYDSLAEVSSNIKEWMEEHFDTAM